MKIEKMRPGISLYDVQRQQMGNTAVRTTVVYTVEVTDIDIGLRRVQASWNGNVARWYPESTWSKWRVSKPALVKCGFGERLATRAEIATMKEKKP